MQQINSLRKCPVCHSGDHWIRYCTGPFYIVTCRACSLTFNANPPDEGGLYERYYEVLPEESSRYDAHAPVESVRELFHINSWRCRAVRSLKTKGSVLDIGCGPGYFLKTISESGFAVRGVEISKAAAEFGRERFGLDICQGTMDDCMATGGKFDVITLWHVLEHFPDPVDVLRKVRALLATDGIALVEVPNLHSLKFMLSREKWSGGNDPLYHRSFFCAKTLQQCLQEAGFKKTRRLRLSYPVPGRGKALLAIKRTLNFINLDSFLAYAAYG
jgi:2-polyprenyl-3-methyl-5-hydroxy-6-metoxy-1,4-benzoquinol methylase